MSDEIIRLERQRSPNSRKSSILIVFPFSHSLICVARHYFFGSIALFSFLEANDFLPLIRFVFVVRFFSSFDVRLFDQSCVDRFLYHSLITKSRGFDRARYADVDQSRL